MPPRIAIFVATAGAPARGAAGAACEAAPAGRARPLTLTPGADPVLRAAADRLAESLDLRPLAPQLAVLQALIALLRERRDAVVVLDAPGAGDVVRLLAAADLARARLQAGRPAAGVSTLAASRAGAHPDLPVLREAALAGDLLRAPELTVAGFTGEAVSASERHALALAGVAVASAPLGADDAAAAAALEAARASGALDRGAAAVTHPTPGGADLTFTLPGLPDGLRAVRSGAELAVSAGEAERRLRAPLALGALVPEGVQAGDDGTVVARFAAPAGDQA